MKLGAAEKCLRMWRGLVGESRGVPWDGGGVGLGKGQEWCEMLNAGRAACRRVSGGVFGGQESL